MSAFALMLAAAGAAIVRGTPNVGDPDGVLEAVLAPATGDLDALLERQTLRLAIPQSTTYLDYHDDRLVGLGFEIARELESYLNGTQETPISVLPLPLPENDLIGAVEDGRADLALGLFSPEDGSTEKIGFTRALFGEEAAARSLRPAPRPGSPADEFVASGPAAIRWALRPEDIATLRAVSRFSSEVRQGTLVGNLLARRYLEKTAPAPNVNRIHKILPTIQRRARQYGIDWRLALALAYQESKFNQSQTSNAGAVGVMQVLPSTAADPNVGISGINNTGPNIHAGVKYLAFLRDRYFSSPGISPHDRVFLSLAAYNAGPAAVARARAYAAENGLDPDIWFGNVEMAVTETVSPEPVTYVQNIRKYFVALNLADRAGLTAHWEPPLSFFPSLGRAFLIWWLVLGVAVLAVWIVALGRARGHKTGG